MKRVKECPTCGLYNDRSNDFCEECGASLDDIILTVDDNLVRDPDFQKKKDAIKEDIRKSDEQEKENQAAQEETIVCPECGTINPASAETCLECGTILHPKKALESQAEVKKEPVAPLKEKQEEVKISSGISRIQLTSPYGLETLNMSEEKKVFGREQFTSSFLKDYLKISRHHFEYYLQNQHVFIIDCSTNGTWLNGEKLVKGNVYELHNMDKLSLADLVFDVTLC